MLRCFCGTRHGALACAPEQPGAAPPSAGPADPALLDELVAANHILAAQGVVDGFGHVSARHDRHPGRYLLSRSLAPALVGPDDIMEFDLDSHAVDPRGRTPYLERFIHGAIYRARPDVMAVVHNHSPSVIPFGAAGVALRPIYHMSGFLGAGAPLFEIRDAGGPATDLLVRDQPLGDALATTLGPHAVALMRGHGCVVVGASVKQAVFRAIYTEMNARLQAEASKLGPVTFLTDGEAAAAARMNDAVIERPWGLWRRQVSGG